MQHYRALTWDHPRGYNALAAATAALDTERDGISITWDRQPLEGFESHPIEDLCARYDLVVLDHPHIGDAVGKGCLLPLEELFGAREIEALEAATIGPCFASYRFDGRHWALPLDAAAQVMAARPDLLGDRLPTTWDEVEKLSAATGKVALSLAGPHALLSYFSIAAALGEPPARSDPDVLVSAETGRQAVGIMAALAARSPRSAAALNPIGILEHMATGEDVLLCPLVFGYVNYAAPASGQPLRFADAPRMREGALPGSTLGGTGIGISRRSGMSEALKRHLLRLMSEDVQTTFIPVHDGQPSRRSAWHDDGVNRAWNNFYRDTCETLEHAYVRPRHAGYIGFQGRASALLRKRLEERMPPGAIVEEIQRLYSASRVEGGQI
jgi:multiple sugar transport system substrate-binding protein